MTRWGRPAATRRFSLQPVVATWRPEDADDRGAEDRPVVGGKARHDVGSHPALAVRGVGERHEHLLPVERVALLDGVADGQDARVARAEPAVDEDAAEVAGGEAGIRR